MSYFVYSVTVPAKTPKYMQPVTDMMKSNMGTLFVGRRELDEFVKQLKVRAKEVNAKSGSSCHTITVSHHHSDTIKGGSISLAKDDNSGCAHSMMFYKEVERVLQYDETLYGFVDVAAAADKQ